MVTIKCTAPTVDYALFDLGLDFIIILLVALLLQWRLECRNAIFIYLVFIFISTVWAHLRNGQTQKLGII